MSNHEKLRRQIENAVQIEREKAMLRREIFDLAGYVEYMREKNLVYLDREIGTKMTVEELKFLISNREKRIEALKSFAGKDNK